MKPYFEDASVTLYLGDCRAIVPDLGIAGDLIVTDPPYASTSLEWDRWPEGWLATAALVAPSMWMCGTLRMFMDRATEIAWLWQMSQDVVWEKHNGSGFHADRFRRVHEQVAHFYRGAWGDVYHDPQYTMNARRTTVRTKSRPTQMGHIERTPYRTEDGGPKLTTSVIRARSMHGTAIHPTEKPVALIDPLIRYGCPTGGTVVDLFAGSGSTLDAARRSGRRAIGIEAREEYAQRAAERLSQAELFGGVA